MDGTGVEALARRIGSLRLGRIAALRRLGALALAPLIAHEVARAKTMNRKKKEPVCLCPTAAAKCRTVLVPARKVGRKTKAACNYRGRCRADTVVARCVPLCARSGSSCVFATGTTHGGNLGGLTGADAICQGLAEGAGLPGTYKAWLSDATGSPSTRFVRSPGPYVLGDGTTVANGWDDLTTCEVSAPFACLAHAIDRDETGNTLTDLNYFVWTNTDTDGSAQGSDYSCQNWSETDDTARGRLASCQASDAYWTSYGDTGCKYGQEHLYCFQQS